MILLSHSCTCMCILCANSSNTQKKLVRWEFMHRNTRQQLLWIFVQLWVQLFLFSMCVFCRSPSHFLLRRKRATQHWNKVVHSKRGTRTLKRWASILTIRSLMPSSTAIEHWLGQRWAAASHSVVGGASYDSVRVRVIPYWLYFNCCQEFNQHA